MTQISTDYIPILLKEIDPSWIFDAWKGDLSPHAREILNENLSMFLQLEIYFVLWNPLVNSIKLHHSSIILNVFPVNLVFTNTLYFWNWWEISYFSQSLTSVSARQFVLLPQVVSLLYVLVYIEG